MCAMVRGIERPLLAVLIFFASIHGVLAADVPSRAVLARSLKGKEWVTSLALSPDGKTLAVGDWGEEVHLWDVSAGKLQTSLPGHGRFGSTVSYNPNGKTLASVGKNEIVKIWNLETGQLQSKFEVEEWHKTAAFSPDGATLAIGGRTLRLLEVATGKTRAIGKGDLDICCIAFHRDGKMLATVSSFSDDIVLYDAADGKEIARLSAQTKRIRDFEPIKTAHLAFSPDGQLLARTCQDDTIRVWDVATRRELQVIRAYRSPVYAVTFSPNSSILACSSQGTSFDFWDPRSGKRLFTGPPTTESYGCILFSADGKTLITGAWSGNINFWNLAPGNHGTDTLMQPANPVVLQHDSEVWHVAYRSDGKVIATLSKSFQLWDAASGKLISKIDRPQNAAGNSFNSLSLDQTLLTVRLQRNTTGVMEVVSGAITKTFPQDWSPISPSESAISPDGKILALMCPDGHIAIWELESKQLKSTLKYGDMDKLPSGRRGMAFSPDGTTLTTSCTDDTVKFWDSRTGAVKSEISVKSDWIQFITFSPDGEFVAFGDFGNVSVWNWNRRECLGTFETKAVNQDGTGSVGITHCVAFTRDGKTLISTCPYGTVRLWSLDPINLLPNTFTVHSDDTLTLAVSPDGNYLSTGSRDKTVKVWKLMPAR